MRDPKTEREGDEGSTAAREAAAQPVSLFVTGEGLTTGEVCKTDLPDISPAAACSPVLAQEGVEEDPLV